MAKRPAKSTFTKRVQQIWNAFRNIPLESQNVTQSSDVTDQTRLLSTVQYPIADLTKLSTALRQKSQTAQLGDKLMSQYMNVASQIKQDARTNKMLVALTPELTQAERILIGSILSPNDMDQTTKVTLVFNEDKIKHLQIPTETLQRILSQLTTWVNDSMHFNTELAEWLKTILFEEGAKAIAVLPKSEIDQFTQNVTTIATESLQLPEQIKDGSGTVDIAYEVLETLEGNDIKPNIDPANFQRDIITAFEQVSNTFELTSDLSILKDVISATESVSNQQKDVKNAQLTFLEEQLKSNTDYKQGDTSKKEDSQEPELLTKDSNSPLQIIEPNWDVSDSQPIVLEFPTHAVIPMTIPGAASKHVGYIVLLDELNKPIDVDSTLSQDRLSKSISTAMNSYEHRDRMKKLMQYLSPNISKTEISWEYMASILGILISHSVKKSGAIQNANISLTEYSYTSSLLFYYFLHKKHVKMLYIPASLMSYLCVDYRDNGTGKTIIEDARYILSLKSMLLVSSIMANIRQSIPHTTLTVNPDPSIENIEALILQVRDEYEAKYNMAFDINPVDIAKSLTAKQISVVPSAFKGGNLGVEKQVDAPPTVQTDTDLLDKLNQMWVSLVGIPYSAFNLLNDTEFAKSVSTNNIIFSNTIKLFQLILSPELNKFIRNITIMNSELIKRIGNILNTSNTKTFVVNEESTELIEIVFTLINSLEISLPSPNFVFNKSVYENIDTWTTSIGAVIDSIFTEDMIPGDNSDLKDLFTNIKAQLKSNALRTFIQRMGVNDFDLPEIETIIGTTNEDRTRLIRALTNAMKAIKDTEAGLKAEGEEE